MKRLVALLLALLLALGTAAAGETYRLSLSTSVGDETEGLEIIRQIADAALGEDSSVNAESLADFLYRAAAGTSLTLICQKDAAYVEVVLADYPVLDMTVYRQEAQMLVTSSLMPGYAMAIPLSADSSDGTDEAAMEAAFASIEHALGRWVTSLTITEAQGSFTGDAYDGGVKCTTITLDDSDIAALLTSLLSDEVRTILTPILSAYDLNADEVYSAFDEKNAQVRADNAYSYILRVVEDAAGETIGASLTAMNGGMQLGTLSIGGDDSELRLVAGLGMAQENYWFDMNVVTSTMNKSEYGTIRFREFLTPKDEGYAYAVLYNEPETSLTWTGVSYQSGGRTVFDCIATDDMTKRNLGLRGSYAEAPFVLDMEAYNQLVSVGFNAAPSDDVILPMESGLTTFTSAPSDAEVYNEALQIFGTRLAAKLMKVVPIDLLLQLQ